jgi:hypothetical protein
VSVDKQRGTGLQDRLQSGGVGSVESVVGNPSVQPQHDRGQLAQVGGDVVGREKTCAAPEQGGVGVEGFHERTGLSGMRAEEGDHLVAVTLGVVERAAIKADAVTGQRLGDHRGTAAAGRQGRRGTVLVGGGEAAGGMNEFAPGSVAPVSTNSAALALGDSTLRKSSAPTPPAATSTITRTAINHLRLDPVPGGGGGCTLGATSVAASRVS